MAAREVTNVLCRRSIATSLGVQYGIVQIEGRPADAQAVTDGEPAVGRTSVRHPFVGKRGLGVAEDLTVAKVQGGWRECGERVIHATLPQDDTAIGQIERCVPGHESGRWGPVQAERLQTAVVAELQPLQDERPVGPEAIRSGSSAVAAE